MVILLINLLIIPIEYFIVSLLDGGPKAKKKLFLLIAFIQLFVVHAFLDPDVMEDLPGYLETYDLIKDNSLLYSLVTGYVGVKMEPGWVLICKTLSFFSSNSFTIIYFSSFVIVGLYCISIYRYSSIAWISIFLFLCTTFGQSLFVLRQHTAMAICLASIPLVVDRKLWKFLLVITIACTIHMTSIIFLPLYFVYSLNISRGFYIKLIVIAIICWLLSSTVFMWFFDNSWYNSYVDADGANLTNFAILGCVLLFYLFASNWNISKLTGAEKCFFLMCCLGAIMSLAGAGFSPTNRLIKYYYISILFLVPYGIKKLHSGPVKVFAAAAILIAFFVLFFSGSNIEYLKDYNLMFLK